jgi:hypothetical protein
MFIGFTEFLGFLAFSSALSPETTHYQQLNKLNNP